MSVNGGFEPNTDVGPLISPDAKKRVEFLIEEGIKAGAKCPLDGRHVEVHITTVYQCFSNARTGAEIS